MAWLEARKGKYDERYGVASKDGGRFMVLDYDAFHAMLQEVLRCLRRRGPTASIRSTENIAT